MNTINIKSMIIGFLTCTCIILIMGQNVNHGKATYQGFATQTTRYMINTQTGELYRWSQMKAEGILDKPKYAWKKSSGEQLFIDK